MHGKIIPLNNSFWKKLKLITISLRKKTDSSDESLKLPIFIPCHKNLDPKSLSIFRKKISNFNGKAMNLEVFAPQPPGVLCQGVRGDLILKIMQR